MWGHHRWQRRYRRVKDRLSREILIANMARFGIGIDTERLATRKFDRLVEFSEGGKGQGLEQFHAEAMHIRKALDAFMEDLTSGNWEYQPPPR